MKLSRIAVTDFRKLRRLEITGLETGLNVIVGDNEAGKSTLLAALRAALFERHRVSGRAVEEMLPYGHEVRPTIEVEFDKDGVSYSLRKAFHQRPEAELSGGGRSWAGDAADDELARLLGFVRPGRGESKPDEHHGIFGLLWVAQGTSHLGLGIGAGREQVAGALEREVGDVTGGETARALLQRAEERYSLYWEKSGRQRAESRRADAALEALRAERQDVERRLRDLDADVDRLEETERRLHRYEAEQTLTKAREQQQEARRVLDALGAEQQRVGAARDAHAVAELQHEAAGRALAERQALRDAEHQAVTASITARQAASESQAAAERLQAAASAAQSEAACAEAEGRAAAERVLRLEAAERACRLREAAEQAEQRLAIAAASEARRATAAAVATAIRIGADDIKRLDGLAAALAEARARVEAASVRLRMRPEFGAAVQVGGVIVGSDELVLSRDTTLHIFGYGEIDVRPGGGVAALDEAVASARSRLAEALADLGTDSTESAHAEWERRKSAEAEARLHAESIAALAPRGLQVLRDEAAAARSAAAGLSETADAGAPTLAMAKAALDAAAAAAAEARSKAEQALGQAHRAGAEAAVAAERADVAGRTLRQVQDGLAAARTVATDETLALTLAQADALRTARRCELDEAAARLAAAQPELVQLSLQRAEKTVAALEADIARLRETRSELAASLRARGSQGLGEQLPEIEGQIALAEQQQARRQIEARAAALLCQALSEAQRESKERWLAPVQERAAPYLNLLSGGGSIELDEDSLELSTVRRDAVSEPFGALSMGAREQIAVITRLALADILRASGHSSCVVLDDPLVNADQARLERMHLVLHKAAAQQQILILTCRERDFLGLGAPIFRV